MFVEHNLNSVPIFIAVDRFGTGADFSRCLRSRPRRRGWWCRSPMVRCNQPKGSDDRFGGFGGPVEDFQLVGPVFSPCSDPRIIPRKMKGLRGFHRAVPSKLDSSKTASSSSTPFISALSNLLWVSSALCIFALLRSAPLSLPRFWNFDQQCQLGSQNWNSNPVLRKQFGFPQIAFLEWGNAQVQKLNRFFAFGMNWGGRPQTWIRWNPHPG